MSNRNVTPGLFRAAMTMTLAGVTACYTHRPVDGPAPEPATRIVAEVTDSGTVAMGNALGPGAVEVEGIVADANGEAWKLLMIRVNHRDGTSILWNREPVSFPRYALSKVMERRLDKTRSWIAAGVITASALLAGRLFGLVGSDEPTGSTIVPAESVIPGDGRPE
ncbi:MAG: hypothetical protein HY560_05175 [Gemmatimonadetes bacterium]|nr:hypothetical protein [Gemmatimonadota bacterium]